MKRLPMCGQAAVTAFLALSLFLPGVPTDALAQSPPKMTVQIFNPIVNNYNIYPVFSVGAASATDEWMQAYFKVTDANLGKFPYPRTGIPRIYVNCCAKGENGIPPGYGVTVTLPLFSPLNKATVDPNNQTPPGAFADWWQGGHIEIFDSLHSANSPPTALKTLYDAETSSSLPIYAGTQPTCIGGKIKAAPLQNGCALHFFFDTASIPNSAPQQLLEWTLGADPINPDHAKAGQPHFSFDQKNVDYDVSYVNNAYLPVVMEPYGNPLIGWIGANGSIDYFVHAIETFKKSPDFGDQWPVYTGTRKIASALEVFLDNTDDHFDPILSKSVPVKKMTDLLDTCLKGAKDTICDPIRDAAHLIEDNCTSYEQNYSKNPPNWNCQAGKMVACSTIDPKTKKRVFDAVQLRSHLWGWTPFIANCDAQANQLYNTPKQPKPYLTVKKEFDQLQYWNNFPVTGLFGPFDPYVALIHGKPFINAEFTYAYSVDDGVGNMQTDGTGMVIEVGSHADLPNPDHATPNVHIPYGASSTDPRKNITVTFERYGVCTTDVTKYNPVPVFHSFDVPRGIDGKTITTCPVTFVDNQNRTYRFTVQKVNNALNFPTTQSVTPAGHAFINCSANTKRINETWCDNIYAYQETDVNTGRASYYVSVPAPAPILR